LKVFCGESVPKQGAVPGAAMPIQTFGDFLGFNSHYHIVCTEGCFYGSGMFGVRPTLKLKNLEMMFRHKAFNIPIFKGKSHKNCRHTGILAAFWFAPRGWKRGMAI
jgi:hypothetical protein